MQRSNALVVLTSHIFHVCPFKGQSQSLALCYRRAEDIQEEYCYGCTHVRDVLKRKFGLKTYRRRLAVSKCKHCGESASLHREDGTCERVASCPGFALEEDSGSVLISNKRCTQWKALDVVTGVKTSLWRIKGDRRFRKLVGAPGTYSDRRDKRRLRLAALAEAKRQRRKQIDIDEDGNQSVKKTQKGKGKKTK